MNLSKHFTYEELTRSPTAIRLGIENVPNEEQEQSLILLCRYVLEPLREILGKPIHINSGFRSWELNRAIGGSPLSQHMRGQAADIEVDGLLPSFIMDTVLASYISVDQAIEEFGSWTHLSWRANPRKQFLRIRKVNGSTTYNPYP